MRFFFLGHTFFSQFPTSSTKIQRGHLSTLLKSWIPEFLKQDNSPPKEPGQGQTPFVKGHDHYPEGNPDLSNPRDTTGQDSNTAPWETEFTEASRHLVQIPTVLIVGKSLLFTDPKSFPLFTLILPSMKMENKHLHPSPTSNMTKRKASITHYDSLTPFRDQLP